jgi:UDP-2-acetamido-3-amino-2,3-dideoxy-glucuronate N-acetyltransferase
VKAPLIGVIGADERGLGIIRKCAKYGSLGGIADGRNERLRSLRSEFPKTRISDDANAIFCGDVDAIAIATPAHTHVELALRAIAHGKHVFVDRPLAISEEGALAVARKAEGAKRKVFVGHSSLYHPAVVALRTLVANGTIGDIIHVRTRRLCSGAICTDENVWWRLAPDDMAFIVSLLGEPTSVAASQHSRMQMNVADFVYADLQFDRNLSAHIEVTWLDPDRSSRIDVFGTRGVASVEIALPCPTLTLHRSRRGHVSGGIIPIIFAPPEITHFPDVEPLEDELRAFFDFIGGGVHAVTDAPHGVRTARALAAVTRAGSFASGAFSAPGSRQYVF